jgi:hypothetical protein
MSPLRVVLAFPLPAYCVCRLAVFSTLTPGMLYQYSLEVSDMMLSNIYAHRRPLCWQLELCCAYAASRIFVRASSCGLCCVAILWMCRAPTIPTQRLA